MKQVLVNENILFSLPKTYEEFMNKITEKTEITKDMIIIKYKNKLITSNNYYYIFKNDINIITATSKILGGNNYPSFNSLLSSFIIFFIISIVLSSILLKIILSYITINEPLYCVIITTLLCYYVISVTFAIVLNTLKSEHCPKYVNPNLNKIALYCAIPFMGIITCLICEKVFKINMNRINILILSVLFIITGNYVSYSIDSSLKKYEDEKIPYNITSISESAMGILFILLLLLASPYIFDRNKKYSKIKLTLLFIFVLSISLIYTLPEYLEVYFHYITSPYVKCPQ